MPVYFINPGGRLVRANSRAQAVRHVSDGYFKAEIAKGETIAELMAKGVKCEDARAPETAELPLETGDKPTSGNSGSHTDQSTPCGDLSPAASTDPYLNGIADRHNDSAAVDSVTLEGTDHVF